ncbi:MAG: hypothetical protein MK207_05740 [Saprospiraceae bacterium]|nr:hypothetical protein [Saprospiraceae bacterium]
MKQFPVKIGITDTNLSLFDCSTFLISFPPDEAFANDSVIGWNPWGNTFSFVYNFNTGTLLLSDDYTTIKVEEPIEDAIMALNVYEDGAEWAVEYREDEHAWKPAEYIPSKRIPNFGKWKTYRHEASPNDLYLPIPDWGEEIYKGGDPYEEGSNAAIDNFYSYLFGEGFKTIIDVSNAVVGFLQE